MAGEKSKSSGEFGETMVSNFLNLIGWGSSEKGITIDCVEDEHGRPSHTHGIDQYYAYKSTLLDSYVQEDVLMSTKHNMKYPKSPTNLFKSHLKELTYGMACFPMDQNYQKRKLENVRERRTSGVIFWLAKDEKETEDITSRIYNFNNTDKIDYGPIYLVDNNKISFIFHSIQCAKRNFDSYSFEYHFTGYNNTDPTGLKSCGSILPVQLINTSILPVRLEKDNKKYFAVFLNEGFSEESLKKAFGFVKILGNNWPTETIIYYPDYHKLEGENIVNLVKKVFSDEDFTKKVKVKCFHEGISSLGGD